jgi:hypothetical protein
MPANLRVDSSRAPEWPNSRRYREDDSVSGGTEREQPHLTTGARELFLRQLPVTTDPGARLLEVVSRLGGATSHATPSFTSARLREPRFQPLRGSPQLARLPTAEASNADRQRVNAVRCARSSRMNAQTPASVFNGPEHWQQRAEEARRMADLMSNIPAKEAMLRIAEDYEHLAEWAEERAKRSA